LGAASSRRQSGRQISSDHLRGFAPGEPPKFRAGASFPHRCYRALFGARGEILDGRAQVAPQHVAYSSQAHTPRLLVLAAMRRRGFASASVAKARLKPLLIA
jgi:hypothetical protein